MIRQPRFVAQINDKIISGMIEWSITSKNFYEADTWSAKFATKLLPPAMDAKWFSEQIETFVEILAGFPTDPDNPNPDELTSLVYGRIDEMDYDPVAGSLEMVGRDLTGAFIDAKVSSDYTNQTASQIAEQLARAHGLSFQITKTTTKIGNYYAQDHMQIQTTTSEWDLLAFLARQEGMVVDIIERILYFGPDLTGTGVPIKLIYAAPDAQSGSPKGNFKSIKLNRSQTVVKGITVTVSSAGVFNDTVTKSYPTAPKKIAPGKSSPYGSTTNYYYVMPAGATPQQVQLFAQQIYNGIIQHAVKLECELPGDINVTGRSAIVLSGTNTAYDQKYFPNSITRSMSPREGFSMSMKAQNTSPNLTPAPGPNDEDGTESDAPANDESPPT